ncbi:MAG: ROK family protein [Thermaerobacter sp.]|nr:ROK family protein [Thermaerobacter sp.]
MEYAIDVGGTKIAYAILDDSRIVAEGSLATDGGTPEERLPEVGKALSALAKENGCRPTVVGLSLPGPIARGVLLQAPNLHRSWVGRPIDEILHMLDLGVPGSAQRDALLGGLGEYAAGAGQGLDSFAYLTLGTGVGGGLILRGEPLLGTDGAAGEIGHLTVEPRGPLCGCGRRGCVESVASGTAIAKIYAEETGEEIHGAEIAQRARAGERVARRVFARAGNALGIACAAWAQVANPQAVIAGGSLAQSMDLLRPSLERTLQRHAWKANLPLPILEARLGGPAPLVGAAYYARKRGR